MHRPITSFEDMGDSEEDHRCPSCGGWWDSCDCASEHREQEETS